MAIRTFACLAFLLISGLASAAQPKDRVVRNSIGMTFVQVPSGQFMMGSLATKPEAARDEQPRRAVRITKSFYLGMFEVTQQEYEKVMGNDPSSYSVLMPGKIRERADMIVTRDSCFPLSANLKESIGAEIASLDGVESVTPGLVDFMAVGELGEPVGIQGLPAGNRIFGDLKILRGECLAAKHKGKKGVLVGENLARVYKLKSQLRQQQHQRAERGGHRLRRPVECVQFGTEQSIGFAGRGHKRINGHWRSSKNSDHR